MGTLVNAEILRSMCTFCPVRRSQVLIVLSCLYNVKDETAQRGRNIQRRKIDNEKDMHQYAGHLEMIETSPKLHLRIYVRAGR